jgi:protein-tyrosine sulfotransferase
MKPACFLIGCHRSGTTLARYLLDAHPRIACPPESKFLAGLEAFYRYPQAIAALESLGVGRAELRAEIRGIAGRVLDGYARRRGKPRWIDKTPNYYRILPFLDELFENDARFLFLARHPLDCAASLAAMYDDRESLADPEIARSAALRGRGLAAWCGYWDEVYATLLDFQESHGDRCHLFRYEDLVLSTSSTMGAIFGFLGETAPDRISLSFPSEGGYEDYGIGDTNRVMTDRVGRWRAWPRQDADACWKIVAATASRLGYDLT